MLRRVVLIALMIETAITSETTVNFYQTTQRNISEDGHLRTRRRENLKSYQNVYDHTETADVLVLPHYGKISQGHGLALNFITYIKVISPLQVILTNSMQSFFRS
jgi:hypothetical protein